ncbi:aminodeoxychorismate synthase component I [Paenirhodobacter sp.]|uniref:aminodeoxychorismate synthase component I n=1 Tax=Paenirhodobacter sp. TaxID=1965326 RepID=UPI003B41D924
MLELEFDAGPSGHGARFAAPRFLFRADTLDELPDCLEAMERARERGFWLAGLISYEAGYAFSHRLADLIPEDRELPLLLFGAYDGPQMPRPGSAPVPMPVLSPVVTRADYAAAFARVKDYIAAGDVYQVNLTFPLMGETGADPRALYAGLRAGQAVGHGCLVEAGDFAVLSRSPELFFAVDAQGRAVARPMKGTAPRGATPAEDAALAEGLRRSEKNRAENLMIVDLLRNDLSRVAKPGTVRVPKLYEIETYATLHQMTSTVVAELHPVGLSELLAALFPCGSITGAPKIRAMQVIREVEPHPRGAYCGAIGWVAPTGAMEFSVAIRTLMLREGRITLNVGGGIVADSRAGDEWEEALCKAGFAAI